jgi:hypothetical protein
MAIRKNLEQKALVAFLNDLDPGGLLWQSWKNVKRRRRFPIIHAGL